MLSSDNLFNSLELQDLYLETSKGIRYALMQVELDARPSSYVSCNFALSAGGVPAHWSASKYADPETLELNTEARIILRVDDITYTVLHGYISLETVQAAVNASNVSVQLKYKLSSYTEYLDGVAPVAMVYLNRNATGGALTTAFSGNNSAIAGNTLFGQYTRDSSRGVDDKSFIQNPGKVIVKIMDNISSSIEGGVDDHVSSRIHTTQCPALTPKEGGYNANGVIEGHVTPEITNALTQGATLFGALNNVCSRFFLQTVPEFMSKGLSSHPSVMHINEFLPWRKRPAVHITLKDYMSDVSTGVSQVTRTTDVVMIPVPYGNANAVSSYVIYGEGIIPNTSGKCRITAPDEAVQYANSKQGAFMKVTRATFPAWLQTLLREGASKEITTSDAIPQSQAVKWAKVLARTQFATHNKAQMSTSLQLTLKGLLKTVPFLGKTASVDICGIPDTSVVAYKRYGYINNISFSISLTRDNIQFNASLTMQYMREEHVNREYAIDDNEEFAFFRTKPQTMVIT